MKQSIQRRSLLVGLLLFAVLWTGLMGLGVRTVSPTQRQSDPASASGPIAGTGVQITYVDDSQFPMLTVYMAVNDAGGQPLLSLRQEDFVLTEDGNPVTVQSFVAAGGQAATVLLVIDRSGSMNSDSKMASAHRAANAFIDQLQPGQDRVGIIAFEDQISTVASLALIGNETDKQLLKQAVNNIWPTGGTEFYQAVEAAIRQLERESGRKVVLALTDGQDNSGQRRLAETVRVATNGRVPIYTIGLGRDVDDRGLRSLAQQSDGEYFFSPNADQLEALYQSIGSELRNEYAITYQTLTRDLDGTLRNLGIEIATVGGPLTTEGGYQVGGILASSLNLALFIPLFALLLLGLVGLYVLPGWRRQKAALKGEAAIYPLPSSAELPVPSILNPLPPVMSPVRVQPPPPEQVLTGAPSAGMAVVLRLSLVSAENSVGSGDDCSIRILHSSVSAHHLRIFSEANRYVVEDLSGGLTWVSYTGDSSQLRAVQRNALKEGSLLRLGDVQITFRHANGQAQLERRFALSSVGLTLGSAHDCDIVLTGTAPRQAQVAWDDQRWVVIDLAGSGTWVSYSGDPAQERPVHGRNAIKVGSCIRVGNSQLYLQAG